MKGVLLEVKQLNIKSAISQTGFLKWGRLKDRKGVYFPLSLCFHFFPGQIRGIRRVSLVLQRSFHRGHLSRKAEGMAL